SRPPDALPAARSLMGPRSATDWRPYRTRRAPAATPAEPSRRRGVRSADPCWELKGMAFGRALSNRHGASAAPPSKSPGVIDRTTALGVGVLIGLATVWTDRRRATAEAKARAAASPRGGRDSVRGHGAWAIARRTWAEFSQDRIPSVAAGATFYSLLALFPALGVF